MSGFLVPDIVGNPLFNHKFRIGPGPELVREFSAVQKTTDSPATFLRKSPDTDFCGEIGFDSCEELWRMAGEPSQGEKNKSYEP
jgi:hypothetical protein